MSYRVLARDAFCRLGRRRFARRRSVPRRRDERIDRFAIPLSVDAIERYVGRYQRMAAARRQGPAALAAAHRRTTGLIPAIDGPQPEKGHETWYVVRRPVRSAGGSPRPCSPAAPRKCGGCRPVWRELRPSGMGKTNRPFDEGRDKSMKNLWFVLFILGLACLLTGLGFGLAAQAVKASSSTDANRTPTTTYGEAPGPAAQGAACGFAIAGGLCLFGAALCVRGEGKDLRVLVSLQAARTEAQAGQTAGLREELSSREATCDTDSSRPQTNV
jgi:hypothetical protein